MMPLLFSLLPLMVGSAHTYDPDRPLILVQCPGCGMALAGIDAEAGHTRCRECRATAIIGVDHGAGPDSVAWTMIHDMGATVGVVHIAPIEVVCPTCRAQPGEACDRRTMGRKWLYHRARVDAAGGGR